MPNPLKTRIAPTPSGYLHIGNALSFLYTWLIARKSGGWLMLRIDDSDSSRVRDEFLEDIFQTIDWLGIDYDFGANGVADFKRNYSQKHKIEYYNEYLKALEPHLYACKCSRKQISKESLSGIYPQTCLPLHLSLSTAQTAWRIKTDHKPISLNLFQGLSSDWDLGSLMGDFVVRRKNQLPAYQVISLAEDIAHNINFLVRGSDLVASSVAQMHLAKLLGNQGFETATFLHHPLILESPNRKLSKTNGAIAIKTMREAGVRPQQIYQLLAKWLGISKTVQDISELLYIYDIQIHKPKVDLYLPDLIVD